MCLLATTGFLVMMEVLERTWGGGGGGGKKGQMHKTPFFPSVARRGQRFWTPACLLFGCLQLKCAILHLAPGCVLELMRGTRQLSDSLLTFFFFFAF